MNELDGVMLGAIRYRASQGYGQAVEDRAWLLRYIDRLTAPSAIELEPSRCTECGELVTNRVHHEQSLGAYHLPRLAAYAATTPGDAPAGEGAE